MPCDKLTLLSKRIRKRLLREAEKTGKPRWGYKNYLDLRTTKHNLPIHLYCNGRRNGIHKIEFIDVSRLGLSRTRAIARLILPPHARPTITRIDWCVDLPDVPLSDVAASCLAARAQNCAYYHSRNGSSFYPQRSSQRSLLIYEKLRRARVRHEPFAEMFPNSSDVTRIEIQLRSRGVPIRSFERISEYADLDLLANVSFACFVIPPGLAAIERLAAQALKTCAGEVGLQRLSKNFSRSEWAKILSTFLRRTPSNGLPDIHALFQKSKRDWLESRIRFPRLLSIMERIKERD
jgi:hypothetical protein